MKTTILTIALLAMTIPVAAQSTPPQYDATWKSIEAIDNPPEGMDREAWNRTVLAVLPHVYKADQQREQQRHAREAAAWQKIHDALQQDVVSDPLIDHMLLQNQLQSFQPQPTLPQTFELDVDRPFDLWPERYRVTVKP